MKKLSILGLSAALITLGVVACDDGEDNPGGSGGSGNEAGESTAGKGGSSGSGGNAGSGNNPSAGSGGDAEPVGGAGAGGGGNVEPCDIYGDRELAEIPVDDEGNILPDTVLTSDKAWSLAGRY